MPWNTWTAAPYIFGMMLRSRGSAVAREAEMPGEIRVECLRCHHVGRVTDLDLARRGIKPNAPIVFFIKRLRCRKCGSQSVRAERVVRKKAS